MTPSALGDFGLQVAAVFPLNTATGRHYVKNSGTDTGTVATTSRAIDLKKALYETGLTTGAKPLDATVHGRGTPSKFTSIALSIPIKANFHSSGLQCYVTVAHKTRATTAGAGSTWALMRTARTYRFKMGTDTDAVLHSGVFDSVNAMAIQRFYKANLTYSFKLASSTAAKDTTTSQGGFIVYNPSVILYGGLSQPSAVPQIV